VSDTCTHARVPLSGGCLEGRQVVCPWHAAMFDLKTGVATCGPASVPLRTYEVRIEGDQIVVSAIND
jgi:3-phenylpropionate/trans-cinnamate dioxygenase ferredoxin subunit